MTGFGAVAVLLVQAVAVPALVGLWDFAGIFGPPDSTSVPVYLNPSTTAAIIARLDHEGIASADGSKRSCIWVRDYELAATPSGCVYTESGYEIPAIAVFDRQGNWLRIALDNRATRFGWIQTDGAFHPLAELLVDNLTYLTGAWNRRVHDSLAPGAVSGGGRVARISGERAGPPFEQPYRAIGSASVQGRLWLHVELLDETCGAQEPRVIDRGWVPAQSPAGDRWAWFWSRGC